MIERFIKSPTAESLPNTETELFDLAFDLAYFIHVSKEIAFFVAEDALDGLTSVLNNQKKNRIPSERLRGFWKSGERTRPVRTTLALSQKQILQWLVFKESQKWERLTEQDKGLYSVSEEDLIIRYIEYLVFTSVRRGSFYTTLALCSLLYQFDRRETRLFYDVLTQSDSARMKDTNYIGKQRLELISRITQRFAGLVEIVNRAGDEKQFVMRSTTEWVINLVNQSLQRFTPWDTTCVIEPKFEVTDIPSLYFSERKQDDEDLVEMNRIHTVVDPHCLTSFMRGLSEYVKALTSSDLDKGCNFDPPNERLALPQFGLVDASPPRGDRFHSPKLSLEDYIRVQRTLDARGRRKRTFEPQKLIVYVDDVPYYSFDTRDKFGMCKVGRNHSFIEIRGQDSTGEITLALLFTDAIETSKQFAGSIIHSGGQEVTVKVNSNGSNSSRLHLELAYQKRLGARALLRQFWPTTKQQLNRASPIEVNPTRRSLFAPALIAAIIAVAALLSLWQIKRLKETKTPDRTNELRSEKGSLPPKSADHSDETNTKSPIPPTLSSRTSTAKSPARAVAQARWIFDSKEILNAVSIESTRSENRSLEFSGTQTDVLLSLPIYHDEGKVFSHYRVTISTTRSLWQRTLRAPENVSGYAHVLRLLFFPRRLPKAKLYVVRVQGFAQTGWRDLGSVTFTRN